MIHFHGGPITPDTCALKAWKGRHAFISFANPGQLALASEVTQSFALDNRRKARRDYRPSPGHYRAGPKKMLDGRPEIPSRLT